MLRAAAQQAQILHLFANDIHPNGNEILEDFDIPTSHLYRHHEVPYSEWTIAEDCAICEEKTMMPSCPVYGYFFTNRWGEVMWSERFPDGPYFNQEHPNFEVTIVGRMELTG